MVWDFTLNMTHYKNKLVKLPDAYKTNTSADGKHTGLIDGSYFREEGRSFFTWYLPTFAGVGESGQSLWYTYNKDGERITTDQYTDAIQNGREMQGDALPDLYGGFGSSVRFFGVDLSVNFTYQIGGQVLDSGYMYYMSSPQGTTTNNYHRDLLKAWSEDNTGSKIPRFVYGDAYSASSSDRFLTDASRANSSSRNCVSMWHAITYGCGRNVRDLTHANRFRARQIRSTMHRFVHSRVAFRLRSNNL